MKTLIVEDDFTSRLLLQNLLNPYGQVHIAVNGREAVQAVQAAIENNHNYNLICLDIMMPEMDGQQALKKIRQLEEEVGVLSTEGAKIIMTTALNDIKNVKNAFQGLCDGYIVKPIDKSKLLKTLADLGLIQQSPYI